MLSSSGVHSDIVENGSDVVDRFDASPDGYYDAILMDVKMPVMTGLEATKEIRKLNRKDAKNIPIIALTSSDSPDDVQKSIEAGMDEHLSRCSFCHAVFKVQRTPTEFKIYLKYISVLYSKNIILRLDF